MATHIDQHSAHPLIAGRAARTSRQLSLARRISLSAVSGLVLAANLVGATSAQASLSPAPRITNTHASLNRTTTRLAQPRTVDLVIAASTDVHGHLRGWDYYNGAVDATQGLSRIATVVDSVRLANPDRVVLLDAGDLLQGTPLTFVPARVTRPSLHPVIAAMNAMRYDAATVGNHEFNYGVPFLDATVKQAHFPFLAANVKNANGTLHYPSTITITRGGIRIAIVGATTQGANVWDRDHLRSARVTVTDIVPTVRSAVAKARATGADVVVVLLHSGIQGEQGYDTTATKLAPENVADRVAKQIPGIDLIVFGHTHRELADTTIAGTLLMQPRNGATSVGLATLSMQKKGVKWEVASKHGVMVQAAGHVESRAVLAVTDAGHRAAEDWVKVPVGQTATAWRGDSTRVVDTPLVDFVLETMRRVARTDLAATPSFSLDAHFDVGAITIAHLAQLYPYDNTLRAVRVTGKQLREFLEHSSRYYRTLNTDGSAPAAGIVDQNVAGYNFDMVAGADYTIDLRKPIGQRITSLSVKGKSVTDSDSFTMALNNYRQNGGGGYSMVSSAPVTFVKNVDLKELLIDEVKHSGIMRPADYFKQNWHIEPASAVALAYAAQNRTRSAATGARTLRVITTSDFHAALEGRKDDQGRMHGGAVALLATITQARNECKNTCTSINIDGGDLFSGTPASDWDSGRPTVAAYNRLGISAGALGNHEFDFGQDTLKMRLAQLNYRVLAANVVGDDGKIPSWLKPDTIVERNGLRIGIVGVAAEFTPTNTKSRNVKGLKFLPEAPAIDQRIRALRAQQVDAVIVTMHDGGRCQTGVSDGCSGPGMSVVRALTEKPDAVVLAHAHTNVLLNINGIPSVQVSSNGRSIGVIDIPLSPTGEARITYREVYGDSLASVDPILDTIVQNAVERVRVRLEKPVAIIAEQMTRRGEQYPLGNLIADAMRVMSNSDFGAWNNGGIRADLRAGPANVGTVHELSPFGNNVVRVSVRGRDLSTLIENFVRGKNPSGHVSGIIVTYDSTKAPGQRIVSLTLPDGRALEPDRVYTMGINDFMLDDPTFMRPNLLVSTEILAVRDEDAIAEYLRRLPQPVKPPSDVRIHAAPASREEQ